MTNNNPWENMGKSVERRVKEAKQKKIYWVTDIYGRYGISFRASINFTKLDNLPKLRGLQLQKSNLGENKAVLNIILNSKNEWELFLALCNLIFVQSRRVLTFSFKLERFQLRRNAPNSTFPNKLTGRSNFSFDLAV